MYIEHSYMIKKNLNNKETFRRFEWGLGNVNIQKSVNRRGDRDWQ